MARMTCDRSSPTAPDKRLLNNLAVGYDRRYRPDWTVHLPVRLQRSQTETTA